ncbi:MULTISPECIES: glycosyltransferase [Mesorhizobium]|uniref:Glycosyltransferase family 1 protein n=1 Tax=Mesorhizobium denitrificans TaxID=2294114 RepID=A0A371X9P5_9HYPH|nr:MULTISPECIES: glycosyltransferase family 1 protein [Mesorhizobium]RFC65754.1 glycosyltransferase family 1 protein [Mesorhizobium denitrificans]
MQKVSELGSQDILLFFKNVEVDKFLPGDRYIKRILRPAWNLLHHRQKKTGFQVSFEMLADALRANGFNVRVNDYAAARKNPNHPVGVVGFPVILDGWRLPNPVLLGPSLYDHPGLAPKLFADKRFKSYLVLADWMKEMFAPYYGERCVQWFAGIDLDNWPDLSREPKQFDFLIYDKIRWDHDQMERDLIEPIRTRLHEQGHTFQEVRYKMHDHATLKTMLAQSRAMIFLCEHETQGLAYQEALASGVPVLAWDRGYWADPLWQRFLPSAPPASSVPFFSEQCGARFAGIEDFPAVLDNFWNNLTSFKPRNYVKTQLSPKRSAQIYADAYFGTAR